MRPVEGGIEVQVLDDTWYELVSIAGVETGTLLKDSKRLCGEAAWKRLTEDLPALLAALGHEVGESVDLELRDLESKKTSKLAAVKMTRENRKRLKDANAGESPRPLSLPATLSAEDVRSDLEALRQLLDERFAYRDLRAVDLDRLLKETGESLGTGKIERAALIRAVDRILRAFGDGHSRIDDVPSETNVFLPCLVQEVS
ncbi:MAG TPA: hypothetical protein VM509_05600, partial [Planctomycetota bacterium]|nr:hypothetical protein [Planctomycetota bacterium]